ncbi:hypothetical protein BR93DRAFT_593808 [Coniochaeta sp. PMI_546]|nr:hypothetical protein BR93DRAFT_593808 [Coniochaeta sp. PMI_546]
MRPVMLMLMAMTMILNSLGSLLNIIILVVRIPVTAPAVPVPISIPVFPVAVMVALSPLVKVIVFPVAVTVLRAPAPVVVVISLWLVFGLLLASLVLKSSPLCGSGFC